MTLQEEEWDTFTDSQNWDALCHYAMIRGVQATLSEEQETGPPKLIARTADPKLNPGAVELTESSSPFRKMLYRATMQTLHQLAQTPHSTPAQTTQPQ